MLKKAFNFFLDVRDRQRISIALTKGMIAKDARLIDLTQPSSWEFSGFSQNGEDGIIDVLRSQLNQQNHYCIEIGFSDGIENNTAWLILTGDYNGLGFEGNQSLVIRAKRNIMRYSTGFQCCNLFVKKESADHIKTLAWHHNPDLFSLDIDGNDYHIANALLSAGFRPKIFVVEYNSVFGPERSITIPYQDNFVFGKAHSSSLYYGASIKAWKKLFVSHGYKFITADSKGVNVFFVDPACFKNNFLNSIEPVEFKENVYQFRRTGLKVEEQFLLIKNLPFKNV